MSYKPNFVVPTSRDGNYLSSPAITDGLERPTLKPYKANNLVSLKRNDFYIWSCFGWGLPCSARDGIPNGTDNVTITAVGSYPAFSPLSDKSRIVYFLWHFP